MKHLNFSVYNNAQQLTHTHTHLCKTPKLNTLTRADRSLTQDIMKNMFCIVNFSLSLSSRKVIKQVYVSDIKKNDSRELFLCHRPEKKEVKFKFLTYGWNIWLEWVGLGNVPLDRPTWSYYF
jgi:hypothetical protein